jgi:radical SAM-linked protein
MDAETFREKLAANFPVNIPIYKVEPIDLKAPSANQLLSAAEYIITVALEAKLPAENSLAVEAGAKWEDWVRAIESTADFWREQTTKSGKTQQVNLRERLQKLELVEVQTDSRTSVGEPNSETRAVLRLTGSCRSDGNQMRPEHLVFMLEQVSHREIQLLQVQRSQLILS